MFEKYIFIAISVSCIIPNVCVAASGSDLVENSITPSLVQVQAGNYFQVTGTTKNVGGTATTVTTMTGYGLCATSSCNPTSWTALQGGRQVPPLNSKTSYSSSATLTVPLSTPGGNYYLAGCADVTGVVAETNENNNCIVYSSQLTIVPDAPPTVSMTAPADNTVYTAPGTIGLNATAGDSDGTVAKVDFYQGTTLLATVTSAPYSYVWSNVAAGTYSITARATDNLGASTTSAPITVIVNAPPTVSLSAPANNSTFMKSDSITIAAQASDSDGSIAKVDFYANSVLLGTITSAPYTFVWQDAPGRAIGNYSIAAVATDNMGASTTSIPVNITMDVITQIQTSSNQLTIYPEPAPPSLPNAGSTAVDPTFGTTLLRLTDATVPISNGTSGDCVNMYSYWPTFNLDSTRIVVFCADPSTNSIDAATPVFYIFDPVRLVTSNLSIMNIHPDPTLPAVKIAIDVIWSGVDKDSIFAHSANISGKPDSRLWSYKVPSQTYTAIHDFSVEMSTYYGPMSAHPYTYYGVYQMSKSIDDAVFAFSIQKFDVTPGQPQTVTNVGYLVWQQGAPGSSGQVLLAVTSFDSPDSSCSNLPVDEVQIDKSGRYLTVVYDGCNGVSPDRIWDLQAAPITNVSFYNFTDSSGNTYWQYAFNHHDSGVGTLYTKYSYQCGVADGYRQLANPTAITTVIAYDRSRPNKHYSMLADNDNWGLVSQVIYPTDPDLSFSYLDDEIFQVATNGSKAVRRLAHHWSVASSYYDTPRANIGRDGQFVTFTSNWGVSGGRRDVYIVKIPPAPTNMQNYPPIGVAVPPCYTFNTNISP